MNTDVSYMKDRQHFTCTVCIELTDLHLCTCERELTVGLSRIPGLVRGSSNLSVEENLINLILFDGASLI
jgi:hypothetical protein